MATVMPIKQNIANNCFVINFKRKAHRSATVANNIPQKAPAVSQMKLNSQPN